MRDGSMYSGSRSFITWWMLCARSSSASRWWLGHDVRDEPHVAGAERLAHDDRLADVGVRPEVRLDVAEVDPVPADLHLVVDAADHLEPAVRERPAHVAGAVEQRAGLERVQHELLRGQQRVVDVALADADAGDADLAALPRRERLQVLVEDVDAGVEDRLADRHGGRLVALEVPEPVEGGHVAALRDAVDVGELRLAVRRPRPLAQARRGDRLAAEEHDPDPLQQRPLVVRPLDERVEGARRAVDERDPVAGRDLPDERRVVDPRVEEMELPAHDQRHRDAPLRDVEAERADHEHAVGGRDLELRREPGEQVGPALVVDGGGLRLAGRARREDRVAEVVAAAAPRVDGRLGGDRLALAVDAQHVVPRVGQVRLQLAGGEEQRQLEVVQHRRDPLLRVAGVDRHVRAARLQHREEAHDHVDAAEHADPDEHVGAHAAPPEVVGERVGALVELAVGQRLVAHDERDGVGPLLRPPLEELVDARALARLALVRPDGWEGRAHRGHAPLEVVEAAGPGPPCRRAASRRRRRGPGRLRAPRARPRRSGRWRRSARRARLRA